MVVRAPKLPKLEFAHL